MKRTLTTTISSLALCMGLLACGPEKPDGTNPPDDGDASADAGDKGKGKGKGKKDKGDDGGGDVPAGEDPTKKECAAEVSDTPTPYFEESVLIRLPKGVTEEDLVEFQPGFARISREIESVSCVEGVPGALISFMVLATFEDDTSKDMKTYKDETLVALGYTADGEKIVDGLTFEDEKADDSKRYLETTVNVPAFGGKDVAKAWFVLKSGKGRMHAVIYETHPNAWNALKATFKESAKKLLILQ